MKRLLVGLVIAAVIVVWLLARVDLFEIRQALIRSNWSLLALAVVLKAGAYYLRARRWASAIEAATGEAPRSRVFAASMVGYASNLMLPARMGDLARVEVLARHNRVSRALALASFWLAALVDYGLLSACLLALTIGGVLSELSGPLPPLVALVVAGAIVILARWSTRRGRNPLLRLQPVFSRLPQPLAKGLERILTNVHQSFELLRNPRGAVIVLLLSVGVWALEFAGTGLALLAFHVAAGAPAAIAVTVALSLSFIFPLTPGNIGTHQLVSVLVLKFFGVAEADALAFSIGMQAAVMLFVIGVGFSFLFREGESFFRFLRQDRKRERPAAVEDGQDPAQEAFVAGGNGE